MPDQMRDAARRIAAAVTAGHEDSEDAGRTVYRASVSYWGGPDDFRVDLHGEDLSLDSDDVSVSQHVRQYDHDTGIARGDVLTLVEVDDGEFIAIAVEADAAPI